MTLEEYIIELKNNFHYGQELYHESCRTLIALNNLSSLLISGSNPETLQFYETLIFLANLKYSGNNTFRDRKNLEYELDYYLDQSLRMYCLKLNHNYIVELKIIVSSKKYELRKVLYDADDNIIMDFPTFSSLG